MTEKKVKKNNWFKQFMIFLLVIVVAVSLGLIIFYFTQDGEKITKAQSKIQVNATNTFTIELTQEKYKSSTKIEPVFDKKALSIAENDGITTKIEGKTKKTTYQFKANAEDGTFVAGTYTIDFNTTAKDKASKKLSVEVVIADGEVVPFFVGDAEQLKNIGSGMFGNGKKYELTQDIDLKSLDTEEGVRTSWNPLVNFSGTLNGNGHKISNLYINAENAGSTDVGFFAALNPTARVYNVEFDGAEIVSDKTQVNAGVVAGQSSGSIERVRISGNTNIAVGKYEKAASATDVDATDPEPKFELDASVNVGTVVGVLKRSGSFASIDRVAVMKDAKVFVASKSENDSYVGGIAGLVQNGTIMNSYAQGTVDVKGTKVFAGGFAGKTQTLASLVEKNQPVTTNKKANIINSYTTTKLTTDQPENTTIGAVIAKNENLGLLSELNKASLDRTYVDDKDSASTVTQEAVAGLTDQNFKTSISNKVAKAGFKVTVGDHDEDKNFNVIYENRFVGVYYKYVNGDKNLSWYPGISNANIAQDVKLAETNEAEATEYTLITSSLSGSQNDYKTINYLKKEIGWDFNNIWSTKFNNNLPELSMNEFTTTLDVYDPQADFDGDIKSIEELKAIDGQNGNFRLKGYNPENMEELMEVGGVLYVPADYAPIALNGNLYGNNVTIIVDYDTNKDFAGLFSSIAQNCKVQDLNIEAKINTVGKDVMVGTDKGFGILTHENYGVIENVVVKADITVDDKTTKSSGIAAMVGYNEGNILNSRTEDSRIEIVGKPSGIKVGFIAGTSTQGAIQAVENFGVNSEIVSTEKDAVITAGIIAGEINGQSTMTNIKAVGKVRLAKDGNTTVGGIAGNITTTGIISNVLVENAILEGNLVGGIAGFVNVADSNGNSAESMAVVQVNETVYLEGKKLGGFVGTLNRGILRNSATYATLKGMDNESTIAGIAYQINGSGDVANCAQVYEIFANVTLDNSLGGTAYKETSSSIRVSTAGDSVWGRVVDYFAGNTQLTDTKQNPKHDKVAGYIENCFFNADKMGFANSQKPSFNVENTTECGLSATECTNADNFSSTFKSGTWTFETEKMPVLTVFTQDAFNGLFKVVVAPVVDGE